MKPAVVSFVILAFLAGTAESWAQSAASYVPSKRARTALDTCLPDESIQGASCIKNCRVGFRSQSNRDGTIVCVATPGARASGVDREGAASPPSWTPPPKDAKAKPGA